MSDTSLTDKVLTEIMRGCKSQAQKAVRQALTAARSELKTARGRIKQLTARVNLLEKGEYSIESRRSRSSWLQESSYVQSKR